jgi:cobalt-zinc-cadmium resistance protein CzcA
MIIDATIIQVENVQRHLSEKRSSGHRLPTVLKAVLEVRKPSIFGELIIATTFLPILSLEGLEGKMFGPLALTVAIALLASLLLSIFVIPVLCTLVLRPGPEKESAVMRGARAAYRPLLAWALRKRCLVISAALAALIAAIFVVTRLGTEFIPIMDEGAFDMDVQLLPGISLHQRCRTETQAISRTDDRHFADRTDRHSARGERRGQDWIHGHIQTAIGMENRL